MYAKIESFFTEYDPERNISFLIYLSVKLKNHYFKFVMALNQKQNILSEDSFSNWENEVGYNADYLGNIENDTGEDQVKEMILKYVAELDIEEQIYIRLYFGFKLLLKHFRLLLTKHAKLDFFQVYKDYLLKLEKWETKEKQKKATAYERLSEIHINQDSAMSPEKRLRVKKRHIEEIYKIRSPVSLNLIAKLTKKNVPFIYRKIKNIKLQLKGKILERYKKNQLFTSK